jgi:hypothetical protein
LSEILANRKSSSEVKTGSLGRNLISIINTGLA